RRQPADLIDVVLGERNAIIDQHPTKGIGLAAAAVVIELPAGHVGPIDFPAVLVFELHEAAFAAAVAERLPLGRSHIGEALGLPERQIVHRAPLDTGRLRSHNRLRRSSAIAWAVVPGLKWVTNSPFGPIR